MAKKVVAFIPLRMNSKRVPGKNLYSLRGKPLFYWICLTLTRSQLINEVYVYCSDESVVPLLPDGCKFLQRSTELDGDLVEGADIYRAFASEVSADIYVLAHATSPFLTLEKIDAGVEAVTSGKFDSAYSAVGQQTFAWFQGKPLNYQLNRVVRTQELEPVYFETSGFYIYESELLEKYGRRIGFRSKPILTKGAEALDIDNHEEMELAVAYSLNGFLCPD